MAESKTRRVRDAAMKTLLASTRIRAQREVVGAVRRSLGFAGAGDAPISIHDAEGVYLNEWRLPGKLLAAPYADAVAEEAYEGLALTRKFFDEVYGRDSLDDGGMPLVATIHYGDGYNNAFWNGRQMVFGDGDGEVFVSFTKSIDIVAHELAHGVTQFTADLEYHNQEGALNESFSDVFGSLVKQYAAGQDVNEADWLIGAELLGPTVQGDALRSMKNPGGAYDDPKLGGKDPQPKHMKDFLALPDDEWNDWGGVHINSGIPNYAFYVTAMELGGAAWEDAGEIWYQALLQLWSKAQFQDCANVTVQVAGALFGSGSRQQKAVLTGWDAVGVPVSAMPMARRRKSERSGSPEMGNGALRRQLEKLGLEIQKTIEVLA